MKFAATIWISYNLQIQKNIAEKYDMYKCLISNFFVPIVSYNNLQ